MVKTLSEQIKDPGFFAAPEGKSQRIFSKEIDKKLGFRTYSLENQLLKKYRPFYKDEDGSSRKRHYPYAQTWIGLNPQTLLTPYPEILKFLEFFRTRPPNKVIDLGAAYGRVGLVLNAVYPKAQFMGIELVETRAHEARRIFKKFGINNSEMLTQNITEEGYEIPDADIYFIYDFGNRKDLEYVIEKLSKKMKTKKFALIVKGDFIRSTIQFFFPMLLVKNIVTHEKEWSIYYSH